jgi:hypothetical protein
MNDNPKTHPLNVSYLVVGLIFLGIAGSWALHTSGVVDTEGIEWLIPAVLVAAGAIGLVAFAAKGISRSRNTDEPDPAYDTAYDTDYDPYPTYDTTTTGSTSDTSTDTSTDTTTQIDTHVEGDDR